MIRRTGADDWQLLREARLRALAEEPDAFVEAHAAALAFPESRWRERAAETADSVTFVHEADGRFDGMVSGFLEGDPETVFLVSMWVAPERRGLGLAQALVERVLDWARTRRAGRVLLSVEAGNERAARLYARCGFVRLAEPPPLPWESDSPVYELRL
ncbi:MAG TPA: GNAT family N-acetyltransferase [Gaiellaceae bacterium]|nr:GNAT family N-acetyltransferase [Gaiellaceae bacterium]